MCTVKLGMWRKLEVLGNFHGDHAMCTMQDSLQRKKQNSDKTSRSPPRSMKCKVFGSCWKKRRGKKKRVMMPLLYENAEFIRTFSLFWPATVNFKNSNVSVPMQTSSVFLKWTQHLIFSKKILAWPWWLTGIWNSITTRPSNRQFLLARFLCTNERIGRLTQDSRTLLLLHDQILKEC